MNKNVTDIRKEGLDKFYTNINIVNLCINYLENLYKWDYWDLVIEPSAGSGNFLNNIPFNNKIGIDIEPENTNIIKENYLNYNINTKYLDKKILVIGNPPFGRQSSLAIKFFNKSANFSTCIAFIIPRTFRKISIQNKLNLNFHLILDQELPLKPCCFTPQMNVKCCFQVWIKKDYKRKIIKLNISHPDWDFLKLGPKDKNNQPTPPNNADFAIKAYGGKCGKIKVENLQELRPKSWHWIKSNINKDLLIKKFNNINYSNSTNTARQNSIGKGELVSLYEQLYINT